MPFTFQRLSPFRSLSGSLLLLFLIFCPSLLAQQLNMDDLHGLQPRNIGPAGMSGRVTAIDVNLSDTDEMYIGAASGGLWKSQNGGDTWEPIFDEQEVASVGAVAIDQSNPDVLWVGTGEGNPRNSANSGWGVYKSIDGGRSWQHMGLEKTRTIHRIIVHAQDPNTVIVAATGSAWGDSPDRGIYKTTDGGKSWRKVLYVNPRTGASDLVVDPDNPNKLIAGLWEYRRWPWFFKSGGEGSGLYISYDAGETWQEMGEEEGLPSGEMGRIGLSIAPGNPEIVYAYIESKSNAIYRSDDGGHHWKQMSKKGDEGIGGRPFYYADIFVDTQNENRLYSIASTVTVSEDGGKTWGSFVPGNLVHTDHHAWWSHPEDNEFILLGHDGGLNITQDRGEHWRFVDNLPLGQFYHIRVDDAFPYHIYGGLQDNGSWRGPSEVWFKGGIRNMYWQRLSVGDGFDMVPDPYNDRYGWSMGQGGTLYRYDRESGQLRMVKPMHPDGIPLRYNWNAGIAVDPFDKKVVYYGAQMVMKSENEGYVWQPISPDLTTNNPEYQKADESGGLTYDATGAENFTTIITIVPSTLAEGMLWVGTDDGRLHLTKDGGKNWTDLTAKLKGAPAGTWIPHIHASTHDPNEAFVVLDDHRRDNWEPYVFHTTDAGQTWRRIVTGNQVFGFALSFVQDTEVPNLWFLGTEGGLYVSMDKGSNWTKWTQGYPTVPTMDMAIQERAGDLVLGTYGRSIWILDDIRPLREIAQAGAATLLNEELHLFTPPTAWIINMGESFGYRDGKIGNVLYQGENRPQGAMISYWLKARASAEKEGEEAKPAATRPLPDKVHFEVFDYAGIRERWWVEEPKEGLNRIVWDLSTDGIRYPGSPKPDEEKPLPAGYTIPPGDYKLRISYGDFKDSVQITIKADPRIRIAQREINIKAGAVKRFRQKVAQVTEAIDQIKAAQGSIDWMMKRLDSKEDSVAAGLKEQGKMMKDSLTALQKLVFAPEDIQGIYRNPDLLINQIYETSYYITDPLAPATANHAFSMKQTTATANNFLRRYNAFFGKTLAEYKKALATYGPGFFEDWEALEVPRED